MPSYAIFREEGEYEYHQKELLCVCTSQALAMREVRSRAEKFLAEMMILEEKVLIPHSNLALEARIGKTGFGPRCVMFLAEGTEIIMA